MKELIENEFFKKSPFRIKQKEEFNAAWRHIVSFFFSFGVIEVL